MMASSFCACGQFGFEHVPEIASNSEVEQPIPKSGVQLDAAFSVDPIGVCSRSLSIRGYVIRGIGVLAACRGDCGGYWVCIFMSFVRRTNS